MTLFDLYHLYLEQTTLEKPFTYNWFLIKHKHHSFDEVVKMERQNHIRGGGRTKALSPSDVQRAITNWKLGYWLIEIGEMFNVCAGTIGKYLIEEGARKPKHKKKTKEKIL